MVMACAWMPVAAQELPQRAAVDAVVTGMMQTKRIPGAAVAVLRDGAIVYQKAFGIANLETGTPMTVDSVFELASVTKPFTATAILLLVEEGKVALDDPIKKFVERAPPTWDGITIRHLLTHTSGLDSPGIPRLQGVVPLAVTSATALEFVAQQPLRWPTGEVAWYSDAAYFLLGLVIEKASAMSYREFLAKRIFAPLGMGTSSLTDRKRVLKGRVATYSLADGAYVNWRRDWDYEVPSFFGIWSTLGDLARWDVSLRRATLLSRDRLAAMWTPGRLTNGNVARVDDDFYGLGWELSNVRGHRYAGHQGASGTYFLHFVDEPLTIVVLTNLDVPSGRRHPRLMARSIAGAIDAGLRPPHMMAAQPDPAPDLTRSVVELLGALRARTPSPSMSAAYAAAYQASPGLRAWYARQLGPATYLGADAIGGRTIWGDEPLQRLVHYSADVGGVVTYLSIGLNGEKKVASLDFYVP
jgi:CubicO group peptidase (beta-lactamase class C family)